MLFQTDLNKDAVAKVADGLQEHLSDLHLVYSHLHNFHWNVEGPEFFALHEKLQELYEGVAENIDEVAERILQLGQRPLSTLGEYVSTSSLQEIKAKKFTGAEVADNALKDLHHLISRGRTLIHTAEEAGDAGTADLVTELIQGYEKTAWMFSAFKG